jgi:hypothetical protein
MAAWETVASIATAGTSLVMAFSFGIRQAWKLGKQSERVETMGEKLHEHDVVIAEHTATLAAHEGTFKVIDTKLDNMLSGQSDLKKGQEETQRLIIEHITRESK